MIGKMEYWISLIVFSFVNGVSAEFQCHYDEDQKWHVIGIYSACYDQNNRTEQNKRAEDMDKTVRYMYERRAHGLLMYDTGPFNATYISIDVCNDFHRLPQIIESIYLNEEYYYQAWSRERNKIYNLPTISAIYAEVPPDMMNYLTTSFVGDIRFIGTYATFNASIDDIDQYVMYAELIYYTVTHRLKWDSLFIINVQPSGLTPVFETLIQIAVDSKLCVQYKQIDRSWNSSHEEYFTPEWFRENKPAVITMGDKYGQIEIVNYLSNVMKTENMTIPILAEGFRMIIDDNYFVPENYDCFKDINSSFLTTDFQLFHLMDEVLSVEEMFMFENISQILNRDISPLQKYALRKALNFDEIYIDFGFYECDCSLNYDCMVNQIKELTLYNVGATWNVPYIFHLLNALIFDGELKEEDACDNYFTYVYRREFHYVYQAKGDYFHGNQCTYTEEDPIYDCWKGKYPNIIGSGNKIIG